MVQHINDSNAEKSGDQGPSKGFIIAPKITTSGKSLRYSGRKEARLCASASTVMMMINTVYC